MKNLLAWSMGHGAWGSTLPAGLPACGGQAGLTLTLAKPRSGDSMVEDAAPPSPSRPVGVALECMIDPCFYIECTGFMFKA